MSAKRQIEIINLLKCNENDCFCSASMLSKKLAVSVRTIKSEINTIKSIAQEIKGIQIESVASKGYKLICDDTNNINELEKRISLYQNDKQLLNSQSMRVNTILYVLLNSRKPISKVKLSNHLNESESSLYLDIKEAKVILEKYDLSLSYSGKNGYLVEGKEIDKRRCIANENILIDKPQISDLFYAYLKQISEIKECVVEICSKYKYKVSESILESTIIHFMLTLTRINSGYVIGNETINATHLHEYELAKEIILKYVDKNTENIEKEIEYFAINLHGKRENDSIHEIPNDVEIFINYALLRIKEEYNVDFQEMLDLKVALALHFSPLLTRMKNKMQLKNMMLSQIKLEFPLAFDIASFFCTLIKEEYHIDVSEDEIAYFTLYFNYGFENITINEEGKKILVITSFRKSETILLKQRLLGWFKNEIGTIDFINPSELKTIDIGQYDSLLTTDKNNKYNNAAVYVDLFPTEKDYDHINIAINGYGNVDSIINKFSEKLFSVSDCKNKQEALKKIIEISTKEKDLSSSFSDLVLQRERLSSTYFGNGIGIPHPLYPITKDTFVSVLILENPVTWDDNHKVNLIMLISAESGNPKSFQIWNYISEFVSNSLAVEKVLENKSFDNFISIMRKTLEKRF
ncbi:MAG: BglG family transcription antiterminator [Erysipelotrichaceae bacterium]